MLMESQSVLVKDPVCGMDVDPAVTGLVGARRVVVGNAAFLEQDGAKGAAFFARARKLSRATLRNLRQNLFFAFVYNALGAPLAVGALYPAFGLLLGPVIASAAMSLSSVSVIANALRMRRAAI